ncbi:MAG: hypothetical protein KAS75_04405 [Planctomycetes bacterium]|nr:hypothetical protein [Planctomycetota bacterium]
MSVDEFDKTGDLQMEDKKELKTDVNINKSLNEIAGLEPDETKSLNDIGNLDPDKINQGGFGESGDSNE